MGRSRGGSRPGRSVGRLHSGRRGRPDDRAGTRRAPPVQDLRRRADRGLAGRGGRPDHVASRRQRALGRRDEKWSFEGLSVEAGTARWSRWCAGRPSTTRCGCRRSRPARWSSSARRCGRSRRTAGWPWPRCSTAARSRPGCWSARTDPAASPAGTSASNSKQVDLGLEVELPVPDAVRREWAGRLLIDWGPIPGSYGWVFPKGDRLTVGVIAPRGTGAETKRYLRRFVDHLGLAGYPPVHDSGHLTRCRTDASPLRRGPVLVAGDAAGLLEPLTREGISFALRSGRLAGAAAATAALDADRLDGAPRRVRARASRRRSCRRCWPVPACSPPSVSIPVSSTPRWPRRSAGGRSNGSAAASSRWPSAVDNRLVRGVLAVLARR